MQVTGALQEKSTGRGQLAKPTQICYSLINHRPERQRRNATDTPGTIFYVRLSPSAPFL
jgi:hypothetical protein